MDYAVLTVCIILTVTTIYVSIRTILDTRRRYYHEYLKRKGRT